MFADILFRAMSPGLLAQTRRALALALNLVGQTLFLLTGESLRHRLEKIPRFLIPDFQSFPSRSSEGFV